MACFVTPLTLGLMIALIKRVFRSFSDRVKLVILEITLLGGSIILAVEHAWNGEIVPYPPFLTALNNPADTASLINEVAVVGGLMSLASTMPWLTIILYERIKALKTLFKASNLGAFKESLSPTGQLN